MRTHIAKALQSRCKAIRNAVKTYNAAAARLTPPRPSISWENVSHINFLEEFNLLYDTRQDIRDKQWTKPPVRELMKRSQRVRRAHEEIVRCHISVRRLYTAILDENDLLRTTLSRLQAGDSLVYAAVQDFATRRQQVNLLLLAKLDTFTSSPDYIGDCSRGVRVGSTASSGGGEGGSGQVSGVGTTAEANESSDDDGDGELDGDERDELVGQLIDYVSDLALGP